jgi:anti-sigma factor RsiW
MPARLDGRLDRATITELEEHLARCSTCRAEWQKIYAVDQLLRSAPLRSAPSHLHAQVLARIDRREQARRAIVGSLALALGVTTVALLTLVPIALGLLENLGVAPALLIGGVETVTQFLNLVAVLSRALFVLVDQFAVPLSILVLCSLTIALVLNGLWIAIMRRLRTAR